MKPVLAHQTPQKLERDSREAFRWDASSADQFVLIDPQDEGWNLVYMPKDGNTPAHLAIKAPLVWEDSAGPVFVLARPEVDLDHVVHSYHDIPEHGMAGNVDRYASPEDYLASCRDRSSLKVFLADSGVTDLLIDSSEDPGELSYTVSRCDSGLISVQGYSRVKLYTDAHEAEDARRAGFMVYLENDGTHGGEVVRVFDFYVERVR